MKMHVSWQEPLCVIFGDSIAFPERKQLYPCHEEARERLTQGIALMIFRVTGVRGFDIYAI